MTNSTLSTKRIFTISEAAQLLKVSTKTLRRWEKSTGVKPTRTQGGQRRYTKSQLDILVKTVAHHRQTEHSLKSQTSSRVKREISQGNTLRDDKVTNENSLSYLYSTGFQLLGKAIVLTFQRMFLAFQVALAIVSIIVSLLVEVIKDPFIYKTKIRPYSVILLIIVGLAVVKNIFLS